MTLICKFVSFKIGELILALKTKFDIILLYYHYYLLLINNNLL